MKTVFFGTPDFALSSLEACRSSSELVAVITQPDRPRGRGQKLSPCPVKAKAQQWGVPAFSPQSLRKASPELIELEAFLTETKPDLFVVTAYGNLLPQRVLDMPPLGCINVHASLLPRWRGAAPIQRSIEAGDTETGVCIQKMVMDLDAGDVLSEARTPIFPNESALGLSDRLAQLGGDLILQFLRAPNWAGDSQNPELITHAAKITKTEAQWTPAWTPVETHNRVRAFAAWPQVKAHLHGVEGELKILETGLFARAKDAPLGAPGSIKLENGHVLLETGIRTGEHLVEIIKIQLPGKGPVRAWDYFQNASGTLKLETP